MFFCFYVENTMGGILTFPYTSRNASAHAMGRGAAFDSVSLLWQHLSKWLLRVGGPSKTMGMRLGGTVLGQGKALNFPLPVDRADDRTLLCIRFCLLNCSYWSELVLDEC